MVRIVENLGGQDLSHVLVLDHDDGERNILAVKDDKVGLFLNGQNDFHLASQEERRQIWMQNDAVAQRDDGVGQTDVVPRERFAGSGNGLRRRSRNHILAKVQPFLDVLATGRSHKGDDERTGQ